MCGKGMSRHQQKYKILSLNKHSCLGRDIFIKKGLKDGSWSLCLSVFNRDGWYYDRINKVSWFEKDGLAYRNKFPQSFLSKCEMDDDYVPLRECERAAITLLLANKTIKYSSPLGAKWFLDGNYRQTRDLRRSMRLTTIKVKRQMRKEGIIF